MALLLRLLPSLQAVNCTHRSCVLSCCSSGEGSGGCDLVFPITLHTACDTWAKEMCCTGTSAWWLASCSGGGWQLMRGGCASRAHLLGCSRILSLGGREMGISAAPALPAVLASGWEEHYKFITMYQRSSSPRCSRNLYSPNMGGVTWDPYICYCRLTKALPHLPHIRSGSGAVLQRVRKLKARDRLALVKLDMQPDVKPALFCYLDLCFNRKTTTLSP